MNVHIPHPFPTIRCTIPVERGQTLAWDRVFEQSPYTLVASDGAELETQAHVVRRDAGGRPAVLELLAKAPATAGPANYSARLQPCTLQKPTFVSKFAQACVLKAPHVLVNGEPLRTTWGGYYRSGSVATTRRFYSEWCVGWVTSYASSPYVLVEGFFHRGTPGTADTLFDSLGLELGAPMGGWAPLIAEPSNTSGKPGEFASPRGTPYVFVRQGQRDFRFVAYGTEPGVSPQGAVDLAAFAGWGMSDRGGGVNHGWQAQETPLPTPPQASIVQGMASQCSSQLTALQTAIATGTQIGVGTNQGQPGGRIGWQSLWGSQYGGVTGGGFRYAYDGLFAALATEPRGVLELVTRAALIANRSAFMLVDPYGRVYDSDDTMSSNGLHYGGWRMSAVNGSFETLQGTIRDGMFSFSMNPRPTGNAEFDQLDPTDGDGYQLIDYQHWDRYFSPLIALVELCNDPVAKWKIRHAAEVWWMSQHTDNRFGSVAYGTQIGQGFQWGRAEGHGWSLCAHAYAYGTNAMRAQWRPRVAAWCDTVTRIQMPNGLLRWHWNNKEAKVPPFGNGTTPAWAITKVTEEGLLMNAFIAGATAVGRPAALTLDNWCKLGLWRFLWRSGAEGGAPTDYLGVRPVTFDSQGHVSLHPIEMEPDLLPRYNHDLEESGPALGMGLQAAPQDPGLRQIVERYAGSTNPLGALWARPVYKLALDETVTLLAALE